MQNLIPLEFNQEEENDNILIPLKEAEGARLVNARDLHRFLEVKSIFTNWIKYYIKRYEFIEDEDFFLKLEKKEKGRPSTEYYLTIDTAKELSMLSRTSRGKEARKYFIEVEKRYKESVQQKVLSPTEMLLEQAKRMVAFEKEQNEIKVRQLEQEEKIKLLEAKTDRQSGDTGYLTVTAYKRFYDRPLSLSDSKRLGKEASKICKKHKIRTGIIPDERFGTVKSYPVEVLQEASHNLFYNENLNNY